MLTYKQLLQKCNKDILRNILSEKTQADLFYKHLPGDEMEAQTTAAVNGYMRVVDTMINKEGKWPTHALALELASDIEYDPKTLEPTGEETKYICVNYYNSTAEELPKDLPFEKAHDNKYHKFMGFGLSPWNDFVDCDVIINPEVVFHLGHENLFEKIAAEILWEQTFYGFTEEQNTDFRDELQRRIKDIENGTAELFELDTETLKFKKIKKKTAKKKSTKKKK